jgi:hypothetical protein
MVSKEKAVPHGTAFELKPASGYFNWASSAANNSRVFA